MARRYQIDELLWLRSSPLVTKPTSLPPIEEWMGPIPDPTTQRKPTNPRDHNSPNESASNRRPSLFETRHISRGSNSEDIILGPPKTAFASASRITGKSSIDGTDRSTASHASDEIKNDRYNFRDKFFKDRDAADKDFDRRDTRTGMINGRRGDREDWNNGRPRRTFGGEDQQDRKIRRNGDSDRWDGRESNRDRDQRELNNERGTKDKDGRFMVRRDGQARPRHEGSWFRDDNNTQDPAEAEEEKPSVRNKEWRRDRHGADRDWNRGTKIEQDPEWLDSNDRDEPRRVHTQEDFERWKERMKAGSSQTPAEEKKEAPVEQVPAASQKAESRPTEGELFSNQSTPFQADSMERFFGLLSDAKPVPDVSTPTSMDSATKKDAALSKSMKSSRFAGLFSPPPESPAKDDSPPAAKPQTDHDADQEGFQRILQMLGGGGKSRNATPQVDSAQMPRPPSLVQEQARTATALSSPSRDSYPRQEYMGLQDTPVRSAGPMAPETLLAQNPMKDPRSGEREHLLRLMQQVRVTPVTHPVQGNLTQPQSAGPIPGILNMPEGLSRPQGMPSAQKTPNFLDDPAIANMQRPDGIPGEQHRRRPTNGPPMGYFDDVPFPQCNQVPVTPGGSRIPQGQGHPPMGLQRPPGFDHMPPPSWNGPQLPPQQSGGPSPLAPPPGIPTPTRGINPNFINNIMPMHGNMPPMNERQPFPRGAGGSGSAGFGHPPGMIPPPGYMNGPLPSGFPPMPHNSDALMGLGHGAQGPFGGGNPGSQGPPPSSRHLLDMFGQANGGDARGGMIGPGHFR